MSTAWTMECLDHPNAGSWIGDWDWSGSGYTPGRELADLWRQRDVLFKINKLAPVTGQLAVELEYAGYRRVTIPMILWAREHTDCRVELVDEYGNRRSVDAFEPQPPHHCPTCTCPPK